jgi:hypothetical protein
MPIICSRKRHITREILDKEVQLQQQYHKACLAEEETWRIKSRCLWLKAGDRNSSFFHKQAQARKCFNSIAEIKEEAIITKTLQASNKQPFSISKICTVKR